ncbi:MAG: hypothetical protein M1815_003910 [Lichina confinis]|nr:MAG: hypothetical protein M1815_003910 [Lichina confinis]
MPLIIVSGYPSSGKTHRARQLVESFQKRIADAGSWTTTTTTTASDARIARLRVHHVSDQTLGLGRDVYGDVRREKDGRAAEFSAVERLVSKDDVVVADGLNYIKGYRYQLYCAAKAASTPSCVIHIGTPIATCREANARLLADPGREDGGYLEDIFEDLIRRFEEPIGMNRWDSPLFTVLRDDETPPFDAIWDALIGQEGKMKTVKPHQATVLKSTPSSNYIHDLDRRTQEVINAVLSYQRDHPGEAGGQVIIRDVSTTSTTARAPALDLPMTPISVPQLQRLRRQFVNLNRQGTLDVSRIEGGFVEWLNGEFEQS